MTSRWKALAVDYDETLAREAVVNASTLAALSRARARGMRLVLVTGRDLESLENIFPERTAFDRVVCENGAVLCDPAKNEVRILSERVPPPFVAALRMRKIEPLVVGCVLVATREPNEGAVLELIHEMCLELELIFNKGAVMVLPSGVNKATGLHAALTELRVKPDRTIGIGDGENDHSLLRACNLRVAVANAVSSLKAYASIVTAHPDGEGVKEILDRLEHGELG